MRRHWLLSFGLFISTGFFLTSFVQAQSHHPPAAKEPLDIIFTIDGSGGGTEMTSNLQKALWLAQARYLVDNIQWSRFHQPVHDHDDHIGQLAGARQLASRITAFRQKHPDRKVFVVAFSSGNRVALDACKSLPPGSIDRMILLAPSVIYSYDLTPALKASKNGIDAFYSYEDAVLEGVVSLIGTADGYRAPAAGRVGFWLPSKKAPQLPLYERELRQYPWHPMLQWTGHRGNHLGWTAPLFLKSYVVPMLR